MKNLLTMLAAVLLAGCSVFSGQSAAENKSVNTNEYRVLVLGDIHFEGPQYHGVPGMTYRTKFSKKYHAMWQKEMPELFTASAKMLDENVPFVAQLGDFIQGYLALKEQRATMLDDAFKAVKPYYPNHKLLSIPGNHDNQCSGPKSVVKSLKDYQTYAEVFTPHISRELGCEIKNNYVIRHGEDLYIFYDSYIKPDDSIKFLKETFKTYPRNRYVFLLTHLPLLPACTASPGWVLPYYRQVAEILFEHNSIVLSAHTHIPSVIKVSNGKGRITQMVASSIGFNWNTGKPFEIRYKSLDETLKHVLPSRLPKPLHKYPLAFLKSLQIESYELYDNATGFVYLKVSDKGVFAEFYTDKSGKPAAVKQLK